MKKLLFLALLPFTTFGKTTKDIDWNNYINKKVDSLRQLPCSKVIDSDKETTISYLDTFTRTFRTETFQKEILVLPKKSKKVAKK